jgi:hypothetical protein
MGKIGGVPVNKYVFGNESGVVNYILIRDIPEEYREDFIKSVDMNSQPNIPGCSDAVHTNIWQEWYRNNK